jgi:hypothetical protein
MARVLSLGGVDARTQFVGRFIGASLFTSTTVGLFCGQVGAFLPCGPLLPFLGGSVAGYAVGAVVFWQREKARALEYADKYPLLLEHAFLSDFGHQARRLGLQQRSPQELGDWVRSGSLGRLTWSIIASQVRRARRRIFYIVAHPPPPPPRWRVSNDVEHVDRSMLAHPGAD